MAAAMLYRDRFDHRAGIVYAAGVDHAERVAAAMRATGLRARSVSGRTPPRTLAATLAAYERGDINVLVNAQLLAEGWNAPRATICMHLAPTASRRVYQQRIGRVMRLHRRKEAGVVVDFVDPAAPHSDRTVTLHSLLDVDLYKPGSLVTPKPPRRRQRWRRQARPVLRDAEWLIPVTDDPARRRAVIAEHWKTVSADRLPLDEQEFWAETAARKVAPADLPRLAETLAKVGETTRIRFFATCAAECKHRSLRRIALADLAAHRPDINTIDRMVRLIEAAPTWASDRAQGAQVLLSRDRGGLAPRLAVAAPHLDVEAGARIARDAVPRRDRREPCDPRPLAHARLVARRGAPRARPPARGLAAAGRAARGRGGARGGPHARRDRRAHDRDTRATRSARTSRSSPPPSPPTCPSRRPTRRPRRAARARSARTAPPGRRRRRPPRPTARLPRWRPRARPTAPLPRKRPPPPRTARPRASAAGAVGAARAPAKAHRRRPRPQTAPRPRATRRRPSAEAPATDTAPAERLGQRHGARRPSRSRVAPPAARARSWTRPRSASPPKGEDA